MAKEDFIPINKGWRQARHPVEVLALQLSKIAASRSAVFAQFYQPSILIAEHGGKAPFHKEVSCTCRFEWAADMIAKIQDLIDAIGGYIGEHRLKREPISVHIGNGSKPH
jgi:hypothetical protein